MAGNSGASVAQREGITQRALVETGLERLEVPVDLRLLAGGRTGWRNRRWFARSDRACCNRRASSGCSFLASGHGGGRSADALRLQLQRDTGTRGSSCPRADDRYRGSSSDRHRSRRCSHRTPWLGSEWHRSPQGSLTSRQLSA